MVALGWRLFKKRIIASNEPSFPELQEPNWPNSAIFIFRLRDSSERFRSSGMVTVLACVLHMKGDDISHDLVELCWTARYELHSEWNERLLLRRAEVLRSEERDVDAATAVARDVARRGYRAVRPLRMAQDKELRVYGQGNDHRTSAHQRCSGGLCYE
ncbi:hypothetical protein FDR95_06655 [Rhizobiaceae bacterium LC148]|nr:hypothetical protein FDR95_06655 [Rhizobiaceae bacterium LC148]